ncbi:MULTISPECIES: flagellar biosynthetic protein FliO [Burkholderia]|uniref:Flagellar protein n=1 Tax=Burkholderia cenocepacia TaxID=95486 RepID=A0A071MDQ9_9BURK|nr:MULTISPECIES: flagellar biosynthetic protein FliO [Burkholderia]AOJ23387.1 flagellar biosynthesis protein FliO [Burkholderia seminalis]KVF46296.1 flagellar biosynthesis protein FliO [Burkholderia seminalis]MBN3740365.1 flagellar biosynthetic protein FliO [Burkholderia sp. Tr-20355]MCA8042997.1 flagellar biosynthetic protein FliO [Burkholderia seminalis]MCA8427140.1 flagellar biosynthetic protein FliO [Burkholderia seminalis]
MTVVKPGRRVRNAIAAAAPAVAASLACTPAGAADMNAVNHAGSIASSVMVGSAAPSLGIGAVLQTLVGLAVVIGLVFACAWLARRFGFQPARRGGPLKVVSSVAVGAKENATIVEIGDTWLVLGVAPGNVRLLHSLPAGSASATATAPASADAPAGGNPSDGGLPGTFGSRFRDALAGEAVKRLGRGKDR